MQVDTKEIETYKQQSVSASEYAETLVISDDTSYAEVAGKGKELKKVYDGIVSRKEEMTAPLNESLKSIRTFFKPVELQFETALSVIKGKMSVYFTEKEQKAKVAEERLAGRVERGTMKEETALRKMGEIEQVEKSVQTNNGTATVKTIIKYRVVDKSKIPYEFMEPDMVAIRASFKKGKPVRGIEAYEDKSVAL